MKKVYYQLTLRQNSPLRIGNGSHEQSDTDLMTDGRGLPFIPGTSIAGIIRHEAEKRNPQNMETLEHLFGIVKQPDKQNEDPVIVGSALIVGDAVLSEDVRISDVSISNRDGVGLNSWGTAEEGAKYDFQISETDKPFTAVLEWTGTEEQYTKEISDIIEPILRGYVYEGIKAGARTTRGYGKFNAAVKKVEFAFPEDFKKWLQFNPYSDNAFGDHAETISEEKNQGDMLIRIEFSMQGSFSIRVNTARTEITEDGSVPDSVPLENFKKEPVIPGTAWAGVFRHHMQALLRDAGTPEDEEKPGKGKRFLSPKQLDLMFGKADNPKKGKKSKIGFSESTIRIENRQKQKSAVIRTAIDRFTASPRNAALFTNMVYFGGCGELTISLDRSVTKPFRELLAACICDLHLGLVSVGGEASVGRGIMKVKKLYVNGEERTERMVNSIGKGAPLDWLEEKVS